jgi:hypothetical protein
MLEYALKQERYCIYCVFIFYMQHLTKHCSGCDIHSKLMEITNQARISCNHSHQQVCKSTITIFYLLECCKDISIECLCMFTLSIMQLMSHLRVWSAPQTEEIPLKSTSQNFIDTLSFIIIILLFYYFKKFKKS